MTGKAAVTRKPGSAPQERSPLRKGDTQTLSIQHKIEKE